MERGVAREEYDMILLEVRIGVGGEDEVQEGGVGRENRSVGSECVTAGDDGDVSEAHGVTNTLHDILDVEENRR